MLRSTDRSLLLLPASAGSPVALNPDGPVPCALRHSSNRSDHSLTYTYLVGGLGNKDAVDALLSDDTVTGAETCPADALAFLDSPAAGKAGGAAAPGGGARWWHAAFNLCASSMGAAVLSLPAAMRDSGWLLGGAMLATCAGVAALSAHLLTVAARRAGVGTLEAAMEHYGGPVGLGAANCILFVQLFATTLMVFEVIADQYRKTVLTASDGTEWWASRELGLVLCVAAVFPLCLSKRLAALSYTSFVAIGCIVYLTLVVVVRLVQQGHVAADAAPVDAGLRTLAATSIMNAAFIGHYNVIPIYAELRDDEKHLMPRIIAACYCGVALTAYIAGGLGGYLMVGPSVGADLLDSFSSEDRAAAVASVGIGCANMLRVPLIVVPLRGVASAFIAKRVAAYRRLAERAPCAARGAISAALIALVLGASMGITTLGRSAQVMGSGPGVVIMYVFPAFLHRRANREAATIGWAPGLASRVAPFLLDLMVAVIGVGGMTATLLCWSKCPT